MKKLSILFTFLLFIGLSPEGHCDRIVTFEDDIDGNGIKEIISVTFTGEKDRDAHDYIININDSEYKGSFPYDGIVSAGIIDIDRNDRHKELLVRFDGETDDIIDNFFIYDGSIKKIGEVPGSDISNITGDGIITTFQWMGFWSREAKHKLEKSVLVPIVEEYKLDITSSVAEAMVLLGGPSGGSGITATLDPGTKIRLSKVTVMSNKCISADGYEYNCEWYYIESEDGDSGWIEYSELIKSTMDLPWAG